MKIKKNHKNVVIKEKKNDDSIIESDKKLDNNIYDENNLEIQFLVDKYIQVTTDIVAIVQ